MLKRLKIIQVKVTFGLLDVMRVGDQINVLPENFKDARQLIALMNKPSKTNKDMKHFSLFTQTRDCGYICIFRTR